MERGAWVGRLRDVELDHALVRLYLYCSPPFWNLYLAVLIASGGNGSCGAIMARAHDWSLAGFLFDDVPQAVKLREILQQYGVQTHGFAGDRLKFRNVDPTADSHSYDRDVSGVSSFGRLDSEVAILRYTIGHHDTNTLMSVFQVPCTVLGGERYLCHSIQAKMGARATPNVWHAFDMLNDLFLSRVAIEFKLGVGISGEDDKPNAMLMDPRTNVETIGADELRDKLLNLVKVIVSDSTRGVDDENDVGSVPL
jgi:hypothetical protein